MTWYQCEFIVPGYWIGVFAQNHVFLDKNEITLILMDNSKNSTTCVTFGTHKQISSTMKSDSTCTILLHEPLNEV